jgi:tRNA threonylcarbamoyladenosine biosynthesis protein TsaE
MTIETHSELETERFGERLAAVASSGSVVGLIGPLGAGKTVLVRGIARGLGVPDGMVHSPTFLTASEYQGRVRLAHVDLYRHEGSLPDRDWLAELLDGEGVTVVEWFERLGDDAPSDAVRIRIRYGTDPTHRIFDVTPTGERARHAVAALAQGAAA